VKKVSFKARIRKEGINPYVDPPLGTAQTLGYMGGVVPVRILLEGKPFKANLMPLGVKRTKAKPGTHHRLYLHGIMRKTVGKDLGDRIKVILAADKSSRVEPMNPALAKAFKKNANARMTFPKFSPSHQKELNRYLNHLKSAEALKRNLVKVMGYLTRPQATWFGKKKA
jgi:hypothetical protein